MEAELTTGQLPPMHPRGVVGARWVPMPDEDDIRLAVRDVIRIAGAVVFSGVSGTSKTWPLRSQTWRCSTKGLCGRILRERRCWIRRRLLS